MPRVNDVLVRIEIKQHELELTEQQVEIDSIPSDLKKRNNWLLDVVLWYGMVWYGGVARLWL